jgi:hypothetical protein
VRAAASIGELVVGDEPDAWQAAGFTVDDDGTCRLGSVRVRLAGRRAGLGLRSWTLRDLPNPFSGGAIDAIPTGLARAAAAEPAVHANGARLIDHLVLMTPDRARTVAALEAVGLDVRRVRPAKGPNGTPMSQTFFRLGEVVLEVVAPDVAADGPARFFGLALTVDDLDGQAARSAHVGPVKDAVQPGRRIATVDHRSLGFSLAIALMSPEPAANLDH